MSENEEEALTTSKPQRSVARGTQGVGEGEGKGTLATSNAPKSSTKSRSITDLVVSTRSAAELTELIADLSVCSSGSVARSTLFRIIRSATAI